MNKLFWGLFFLYLDFNLNLGEMTLGLLPDFVGYFLLVQGFEELAGESPWFSRGKPFALGMTVYSAVLYVMNLMAARVSDSVVIWLMTLAVVAVQLYIGYCLVKGIMDMEQRRDWSLEGQQLWGLWMAMAVVSVMGTLLMIVPLVGGLAALGAGIMAVCFLICFYKTKKRYEEYTATV